MQSPPAFAVWQEADALAVGPDGASVTVQNFVRRVEGFADIVPKGLVVGTIDAPVLLNGVGRRIWEAAEYAVSPHVLSDALSVEFAVDPELCRRETEAFIESLKRRGLMTTSPAPDAMRDRYLWLLKRSLTNLIYVENEQRLWLLSGPAGPPATPPSQEALRDLRYGDPDGYATLADAKYIGRIIRRQPGRYSHTMIGIHGLSHIESLAENLLSSGVPGDFVDAGTCRGGTAIFMRALQRAFGASQRRVWVADTFAGVPTSTSEPDLRTGLDLSTPRYPWLAASLEAHRDNFSTYDLLDDAVRFLPGLFAETLPSSPIDQIALLRIDADLYSSTLDCLEALYDRICDGGYIIVDDYGGLPACREAVDAFRSRRGIVAPIQQINWTIVHWRKDG